MTERSANHTTFVIERTYPTATPTRTFTAWADAKAKDVWMDDPDYQSNDSKYELQFAVGGHERFGGLIDKPEARHEGTEWLLDNLGKYLAAQTAS